MPKFAKVVNSFGLAFLVLVLVMLFVNLLRANIYNSDLGVNILMIAKDGMGVVAVRQGSSLVSVTRLPDNLLIPIDPTGAVYRVEAFYKIGLPLADQLLVSRVSVGQALGVVLTGVVKTTAEFGMAGFREALVGLGTRTNLSLIDRYELFKDISTMMSRKTDFEVVLPQAVVDMIEEPDGKTIGKLNASVFIWSQKQWVSDEVLSETAEVTLVNGSGREGKARQVARQLETAGVRVVDLLVAKKETDRCLIGGGKEPHLKTFLFLKSAFACKEAKAEDLFGYIDRDTQSGLVVVLGKEN